MALPPSSNDPLRKSIHYLLDNFGEENSKLGGIRGLETQGLGRNQKEEIERQVKVAADILNERRWWAVESFPRVGQRSLSLNFLKERRKT